MVTELAVEHPPAGLLLRSPFTELADTAAEHYPFLPVRLLLKDRFPVVEHVRRIQVPTTVVYGSADSVVPPEQSRAVADGGGRAGHGRGGPRRRPQRPGPARRVAGGRTPCVGPGLS